MDNEQDNQYKMTTVLTKFITGKRTRIAASEVADAEAGDVLTSYATLSARVGTTPISTLLNTQNALGSRKELLKLLPVIQGPLRSIATKTKNTKLLAQATLSSRQLRKMKPEELRDVSAALFDAADDNLAALKGYALTAPILSQLRGKQKDFADTVRTTSSLIDDRSTANKSVSDLLDELMLQVYELDKPMEVFRFLDKELYDGYKKARRIGGRSTGKKGGANPAPQA